MHLVQALKMACKSLWTNKLRSFLTMLGIIIGVVTVALLTSVASGVSSAVVSSIRTQSTLSIIMNTSKSMTYSKLDSILSEEQPDESADNYFKYSMIKNTNAVIMSDLTEVDLSQEDIKDYINYETIKTYTQAELDAMSEEEKMFAMMQMAKKKASPISSTVYAVDKNFPEIYELEMQGRFPTANDELLVDSAFIKAYLSESITTSEALNQKVSIGVDYYNKITINFKESPNEELLNNICEFVLGEFETIDANDQPKKVGLKLNIIENDDESKYIYNESEKSMVINVEFVQTFLNKELENAIVNFLPMISVLVEENAVKVEDVYDSQNIKTFKIVGVLGDDSSLFTSMDTSSSSESSGMMSSMMNVMLSAKKGTCFMLFEDENLAPLGLKATNVSDVVVSYAYLRYKTESVMGESTTNISLALIKAQFVYMQDFMVVSMSSVANIVDSVMSILTVMLTVISIVSLIVGGIGIMNIMLVAVTERTREIGIRKAIGAKRSAILVQFLVEALMLSIVGGLIGLGISGLGCLAIGNAMGITIAMPLWVTGMSLGFCTLIGLIFGMFPAVKASKMQPIDALRRD